MTSPEIQILVPCHSLEDFPSELTDEPAASLLNAFAIAFHPALLAWTNEFPRWSRADSPPLPRRGMLIVIPTNCDDWLPHAWADDARQSGATVVSGLSDRQEMIDAALEVINVSDDSAVTPESEALDAGTPNQGPVEAPQQALPEIDPEFVADFLSLGTCWLLVELLTRKMRQYGNVDESRFFQKAHLAAEAAIANDAATMTTHLRACFEMLLEARERFYPVDCYLLDLCLAVPDVDVDKLLPEIRQSVPLTLMMTTSDLAEIAEKIPEFESELKAAWQAGRVSVIGSEDRETSLPLIPLESALFHLRSGHKSLVDRTEQTPLVWGRRRFGLTALLPQLLVKFGYKAALHVVLDDGIYPDAEYTKLRWRGVDGTLIDALSRIPLASEGAASYLRFPVRMAESMDHDQVAGLILARWPKVASPWFDDLRRSNKYAPCLGRFVTLDRFFDQTELPGQLSSHKANEYFSPLLIQHVAREEERPIGRYSDFSLLRKRFDVATWYRATANVLIGKSVDPNSWSSIENELEAAAPTSKVPPNDSLKSSVTEIQRAATSELAKLIVQANKPGQGVLVLNPLSFTRRAVVQLPDRMSPPAIGGSIKSVEFDAAHPQRHACVVEVPGCGYAWIAAGDNRSTPTAPKQKLAEAGILRNELFEVAINERTGGLAHVRFHNQRAKRISQQLSFRFPRERTIVVGPDRSDTQKSQYAEMRCKGSEVVHSGTAYGEIATWGEIIDQTNNEKLAAFRQSVRIWRGMPTVDIDIELSNVKMPDGDPWNNYFAARFAWNDITAVVTRSIYHSAHGFTGERFETADYIEVASDDERLTIVPHGLPFHRKTGDRMLDSLLVVAREDQRRFQFTIAIDAPYPLEAAWNATTPLAAIPIESGQPRMGTTGWFFHVDGRHVQITQVLDTHDREQKISPLEEVEHQTVPNDPGFAVRLVETEGRSKPVKLRCFRRPTYARKRNFLGETIAELNIEGDAVLIDMMSYEIVDVEMRFSDV